MNVAVLLGGTSAEREISLLTGKAVSGALGRLGHEVHPVDPALEGPAGAGAGLNAPPGLLAFLVLPEVLSCDSIFIALHGPMGEDGRMQAALDLTGIPYTGSGALASALAMNKDMSKRMFLNEGIPTPGWRKYRVFAESHAGIPEKGSAGGPPASDVESVGGFPVVVKPNDQGSTVGLSVVADESALPGAIEIAARYSDEIIVEKYIPGRELTVSILGREALPVIEIVPEGGLYDYTRKYVKGKSRYVAPADLDEVTTAAVQELGLRAYDALGCRGFGRVDMRLSPNGEIQCLEVNTIPGMTETSLVPMAAAAVGISFDQLVRRIIELAAADGPPRGEESEP